MTAVPFSFPEVDARASDEDALLDALAQGDRAAAVELATRNYRPLWAALYRLTGGDRELAADLTQEAFRRAWAALRSFDRRSQFSTWLYRIAYNAFLNHVRRPRLMVPLPDDQAQASPDPAPGQEQALLESESAERLRRAVLDLPETLRLTVTARYWAELPVTEIARLVGISEVAVRKRLRKALEQLGRELEEVQ